MAIPHDRVLARCGSGQPMRLEVDRQWRRSTGVPLERDSIRLAFRSGTDQGCDFRGPSRLVIDVMLDITSAESRRREELTPSSG